jgi:hypothetical protein
MRIMPGRRFVVVGDGVDAKNSASEIERHGGEVVARVASDDLPFFRAIGVTGIEAVELDGTMIDAEIVIVSAGRQPDIELAQMAECEIGYSSELGGFVPIVNEQMQTSKTSILAAGDASGICDEDTACLEGHFGGVCAAYQLGLIDATKFAEERDRHVGRVGQRVNQLAAVTPSYVQV